MRAGGGRGLHNVGSFASKIALNMRGTISKAFRRSGRSHDDNGEDDEDSEDANSSEGEDGQYGEGAYDVERSAGTLGAGGGVAADNMLSNLLVAEHYARYFREVAFRADDDHTEQFNAVFPTKVVPHGVRSGGAVKDGTGSTERDALVVTTDESIYFYKRLPQGSMLTFRDCPTFDAVAQFSLSDVCQIAIGFAGQRLRIDFVSESWSLITRHKQSTYHFVQEVMPMIKVSRLGSLRRGTLKMPSNELLRLNAIISARKTTSEYDAAIVQSTPPASPVLGKNSHSGRKVPSNSPATPVKYANEDQQTLELIEEHVIGQGQAGRSAGGLASMRVKHFVMLFERPNPSSVRLVRHVPKDRLAPRTLILTESALYLCDEDYAVEWPEGSPPFRVLRSALFVDVVELVLKEHQLDFTLVVSTVFGIVRRNKRWRFRAQNRQVKDMVVREIRRQMET